MFGLYDLFSFGLLQALRDRFSLTVDDTATAVLYGCGFLLVMVVAYLLGSFNTALFISRVFFHDDVRTHGSGNAGTTNVLRTYGKKAAAFTFFGDGLKGIVAILVACLVFGARHEEAGYWYFFMLVTASYFAALFCILGHIFPCFSHFRGGKGFATAFFSILALNPLIFLILCFIFFPLVLTTHYVSLGSIVTMWMYSLITSAFDSAFGTHYGINTIVAFLIAVLVTWTHRANIRRIMNRTENKSYFFHKKEKAPAPEDDKKHDAQ